MKGLIKTTKLSTMTRVLRVSRRWCFQAEVFWVVTPCSVVVVYRRFNGVITQKTSVSVMIVSAVTEIRIAYLTSTNWCHNFMHYIHSLSFIDGCLRFFSSLFRHHSWSSFHLILRCVTSAVETSSRPGCFQISLLSLIVSQASYPMGTRYSFPVGKAAGAWSWPLTSTPPVRLYGVVFS
jgi:hypothetical protein